MADIAGPYPPTEPMSILISPSDNTGWGIGNSMMRATGLRFSRREPVRVRAYYRAQWGQLNGRRSRSQLRRGYRKYKAAYVRRQMRRRRRAATTIEKTARRVERAAAQVAAAEIANAMVDSQPGPSTDTVVVDLPARRSGRRRRAPRRLNL